MEQDVNISLLFEKKKEKLIFFYIFFLTTPLNNKILYLINKNKFLKIK